MALPPYVQDVVDAYEEEDPKNTIIKVWYGPEASVKALKFFYWDTPRENIPILTPEEKRESVFIVYTKKMRKNTYVYFKYPTLSIGEVIREFRYGMKMVALLDS